MAQIPLCRENQYNEIVSALSAGIRLIVISGPTSSGKTSTIQSICKRDDLNMKKHHIFCETDMELGAFYTKLASGFADKERKPRSFQQFIEFFESASPSVIFIDSFDLLGEVGKQIFATFKSAVEGNLLPSFSFVFSSRVSPINFTSDPLSVFNIDFTPYSDSEIMQIVRTAGKNTDTDEFIEYLEKVIQVSRPLTHDIRDIIYITFKLEKSEVRPEDKLFPKIILNELRSIRDSVQSRIVDLPKIGCLLLVAAFIASKTSSLSDVAHLTRASKRGRKQKTYLQPHEYVSLGRIMAISKALDFHHCDNFEFDYAAYIQLQNLQSLKLIEIRGDIRHDPKIKILATEDEVKSVGLNVEIDVQYYISDDAN